MTRATNPVKEKRNVLSLFSGCGGMDLGFEGGFDVPAKCVNPKIHPEWAGKTPRDGWARLPKTIFDTVFANDIVPAAKAAWIPYFEERGKQPEMFHLASVVDLVKAHKAGNAVFPNADVVTGGFPCQDFSLAGKRGGFKSHKGHHGSLLNDLDDPTEENRGKLYMWMRRVIELILPKVFVAENVKGLVTLADAKTIIANDFRSVGPGYLVIDARVLRAPLFGVPQSRERVIFIGFRKDAVTSEAARELSSATISETYDPYPPQTHGEPERPLFDQGPLAPLVTVADCLIDLPEPSESNDPAQRAHSKAKWYGKHCQGQTELKLDDVGPTIRSEHHGNIEFRRLSRKHGGQHVDELNAGMRERRLTVRECARIQTFPDDFEFVRNASALGGEFKLSGTDGYKLVGNAVPPLLAFHIAWRLQEIWPLFFGETTTSKRGTRP